MTANTPTDSELKVSVLDDTFTIVDLEKMYEYLDHKTIYY